MKAYRTDDRYPRSVSEAVAKSMRGNKGKDTKPELLLRKALWKAGIRGYRLHWKKAPGRPDIAFPGKKAAVFINGCYWHRCPHCDLGLPKTNTEFWKAKFDRNVARDEEKRTLLLDDGWTVLTLWECELKKDVDRAVQRVQKVVTE